MARGGFSTGCALVMALLAAGCGSSAEPAGKGDSCFRAQDCREGLVCIQGACSNDVESIVSNIPPPPAAAPSAARPR